MSYKDIYVYDQIRKDSFNIAPVNFKTISYVCVYIYNESMRVGMSPLMEQSIMIGKKIHTHTLGI